MREINRCLAKSLMGLVLITPALLQRVDNRGVYHKELSDLLARDLLIPVVHGTTYEGGPERQSLARLAKRVEHGGGLDGVIAIKIAELVRIKDLAALGRARSDVSA